MMQLLQKSEDAVCGWLRGIDAALLRTVAADCDALAMARGLRLIVRPTPEVVIADALLLEQILRNLVGNAVQNTLSGGVLVGVRPHGRTHDHRNTHPS